MARTGPKKIAQFKYWHLRRKGWTQSAIARRFKITRQAVNKSIKLEERDITFQLLDTAQMSGVLVEWYDPRKGVLIGVTPQLGNMVCMMMVDSNGKIRIYYDQTENQDRRQRKIVIDDLVLTLKEVLGMKVDVKLGFRGIMEMIANQ
jgi:hypothetical protein